MRIPIFEFNFKLNYQQKVIGDTIWQRLKNVLFNRYDYNKDSGGDFCHYYFTFWDVKLIKVYLPTIFDIVKLNKKISINGIKTNYEDMGDKTKEMVYDVLLIEIITHEYLHYVFSDLNLTTEQQHYAINKLEIWT